MTEEFAPDKNLNVGDINKRHANAHAKIVVIIRLEVRETSIILPEMIIFLPTVTLMRSIVFTFSFSSRKDTSVLCYS